MYDNNSKNPIDYKFYSEVSIDSPYWTLAKYFQLIGSAQSKEKMIAAALAYWQPFAAQYWEEDISSLKQSVINSIYRLRQQIDYLQSLSWSHLPSPESSALVSANNNEAISLKLRCRISPDFISWPLLKYFQSKPTTFTEEEMILWSSRAYWQPLAKRYLGLCDEKQDWQTAVSESIKLLLRQIEYLQISYNVDVHLLGVREPQHIESSFNKGISLDDNRKESQTPPSNGQTASSFTQSSVKVDSTPPEESATSKEQKQQINWIDQIDDPLLKPHPDDELIAQMFDNIGKQ